MSLGVPNVFEGLLLIPSIRLKRADTKDLQVRPNAVVVISWWSHATRFPVAIPATHEPVAVRDRYAQNTL